MIASGRKIRDSDSFQVIAHGRTEIRIARQAKLSFRPCPRVRIDDAAPDAGGRQRAKLSQIGGLNRLSSVRAHFAYPLNIDTDTDQPL